ncbi:MAG TPA: alpha/beta fold hydrolase [Baekduia sp.]|nr:alpha/beta fold hydrolase [Baekduia sp.]
MREDVWFDSHGTRCAAWWYRSGDAPGRPCVVMAHGIGATRDSGLEPYAEAFAAAGFDALLFDYRTFGASEGEPRQLVSFRRHREDFLAAAAFARTLDGVDGDRIAMWGTSYGGGHVVAAAVQDGRVAAVVASTPAIDLAAAVVGIARSPGGVRHLLRSTVAGVRDVVSSLRGGPGVTMPIVGPPGSFAVLTSPDAEPGMRAAAGPTWRNEMHAREMLAMALNRPVSQAGALPCPALFVIADQDRAVPNAPIQKAAFAATGRAEVRRYPCGHFDIYQDPWRSRAIADQLHFLRRHLTGASAPRAAAAS